MTPRSIVIQAIDWIRQLAKESGAFAVIDARRDSSRESGCDMWVTIRPTGINRTIHLAVEARKRLTPREAVALAPEIQRRNGKDCVPVVCCPYVSPRVASILTEAHVGYVDQGGNGRIDWPGFFLHVSGRPNAAPDTRPLGNPFSPKASRVVRVLLEKPDRAWHVQDLAREAKVSIGLVSKAKQALMEEGYLWYIGGFLRLADPDALLRAWLAVYTSKTEDFQLYVMADPSDVEQKVAHWCETQGVTYGLGEFAGAWRLAPMVRYKQSSVWIEDRVDLDVRHGLVDALDAKMVQTGANLIVRLPTDPAVFHHAKRVDGMRVLSPLQLYLDLAKSVGRGEEAAEALYERYLKETFDACRRDSRRRRDENG